MSQDKFVEAIGPVAIRGPIVKVTTLASRLQPAQDENKVNTVMVHDGDLIMPIESAVRLQQALSGIIEQLSRQGILAPGTQKSTAPGTAAAQ